MNPWDVFTWVCSVALAGSGVLIFGFFLRDVRGILRRELHQPEDGSESSDDERSQTS